MTAGVARLFAYGTLRPGERNHHVLAPLGGAWRPATLPGRLIWKHPGTARAYPGMVPGGDGLVAGLILTTPALARAWARIDAFEGPEYVRALALCDAGGEALRAHVYILRHPETFGR